MVNKTIETRLSDIEKNNRDAVNPKISLLEGRVENLEHFIIEIYKILNGKKLFDLSKQINAYEKECLDEEKKFAGKSDLVSTGRVKSKKKIIKTLRTLKPPA